MKKLLMYILLSTILLVNLGVFMSGGKDTDDQCLTCHKELEYLPEDYSEFDVHMRSEISCAGCHGGNPLLADEEKAMSDGEGFIGVPSKDEIPMFCGKCHSNIEYMREFQPRITTDQVLQYNTSIHGKKLKVGDDNVADCASCHTSHSILSAMDPRSTVYATNIPNTCNQCHGNYGLMQEYNLKTDQYEQFAESVHGNALLNERDIGAPACNDCHGNHGAIPPGIESIANVCGLCHVNNVEYFNQTTMAKEFEESDFHGCEHCHGYHGVKKTHDDMVGTTQESTCIDCHDEGDKGFLAAERINKNLKDLTVLYDSVKTLSTDVQIIGMNNVEIEFLLKDINQNLIQARTLVHTFDPEKVNEKTKSGANLAIQAISLAEAEIDEYYTRRIGFGIATFLLLILAVGIFFKIRSLSRGNSK
ncbi:cytochrome c3 family protein [Bacteroidota bacterium]